VNSDDIYVYKMVADNGGAPCVWRGLLSLALCKPKIRKSAGKGAVVFGFRGKGYCERLIYVAKITSKPETGAYYQNREFARRPDCIYRNAGGKAQRKANASYHRQSDERQRDVGLRFERADVLLSRDFRYFGKEGTADYKAEFKAIKALIEGLTQGHRVNHSHRLREELGRLKQKLWWKHRRKKVGQPTDADTKRRCNSDTPSRCIRRGVDEHKPGRRKQ
jgi:hypothetical protein